MRTSYFPSTDAGLLQWSRTFSAAIGSDPGRYGISIEQAAAFAAMHAEFAQAMLAVNPAVRTRVSVSQKNTVRELLKAQARLLVSTIQGQAGLLDPERLEIGLTVPKTRSTIPAPADAPGVAVDWVDGQTVFLKLYDPNSARRGKPPGVQSAVILTFVGNAAPASLAEWTMQGTTTRTSVEVGFPGSVAPGTRVWFVAYWLNPRSQRGPTSNPIGTHIQGGLIRRHQIGLAEAA